MKLSIITVNLNNREGLRKTIDSVVSQTFKDFEWIVIDGGSTDGSKELIEQYSLHFAYWVSEPDRGIYHAMNKGIRRAKGEYLQFLNSGDWLFENDTLHNVFSEPFDEDIVYGDCIEADGSRHVFPETLDLLFLYRGTLNHQSTFIRSSLFADGLYSEDYEWVSDWEFFLSQLLDRHASYHKVDAVVAVVQPGKTYAPSKSLQEREAILNTRFSPMERELLERYAAMADEPMRPYFEYICQNPWLGKMIRRMVRWHKRLKKR